MRGRVAVACTSTPVQAVDRSEAEHPRAHRTAQMHSRHEKSAPRCLRISKSSRLTAIHAKPQHSHHSANRARLGPSRQHRRHGRDVPLLHVRCARNVLARLGISSKQRDQNTEQAIRVPRRSAAMRASINEAEMPGHPVSKASFDWMHVEQRRKREGGPQRGRARRRRCWLFGSSKR